MADNAAMRRLTRRLLRASLYNESLDELPEKFTLKEIVDIGKRAQMSYLFMKTLIRFADKKPEFNDIKVYLAKSTYKTYLQWNAINEIGTAFEDAGIRHQFLKGSILKKLYPSPEMRDMSDVDLIVYDESLKKAEEVMENLGYTNHGLIKHHVIFSKGKEIIVEMHWSLYDENVDYVQNQYFNNSFKAKLKSGKNYTYEFSDEDFYIYMIAHMAKHFFETGCGIRNLLDIYIYLNQKENSMDKEYISAELKKCGILKFEKSMRELAFIWMDDKECPPFLENLFDYMVDCGIYGKMENGIWGQLAKEIASDGSGNARLHYYFPSIEFMSEKYQWLRKAPFLLPLAWGIRGIAGAFNKNSRKHAHTFEDADKEKLDKMLDLYTRLGLNFRKQNKV